MGYRLTRMDCSTSESWSKQRRAGGAGSTDFAPVLQLLQPLIGEGEVEQVERATSTRAHSANPGGTTIGHAFGLPRMALAYCRAIHTNSTAADPHRDLITAEREGRIEAGEGGRDLVTPNAMMTFNGVPGPIWLGRAARLAASHVDSFAALQRAKTAASSRTLQRARHGISATVGADTVQTRSAGQAPKARFAGLSSNRPHDRKSRGRGFRARNASTPFTLIVGGKTPARPLAKRLNPAEMPMVCLEETQGMGAVGQDRINAALIEVIPKFRAAFFPPFFVADCSKSGGRR
ncbi:hypothetical protein ACVWZK_005499 [Bradyrhizobium sp. GM0.4]